NPNFEAEANAVCGQWAVKDLDCPANGCLGFSFTLFNGFVADATIDGPAPHRPPVQPLNPAISPGAGRPNWLTQFLQTVTSPDNAAGGQCFYASPPGTSGCPISQ